MEERQARERRGRAVRERREGGGGKQGREDKGERGEMGRARGERQITTCLVCQCIIIQEHYGTGREREIGSNIKNVPVRV